MDLSQRDERNFSPIESIVDHEEEFEIEENFDHFGDHFLINFNTVVGNILLALREHFNFARKATCSIAEKMSQIICSDQKLFGSILRKPFVESGITEIGHQVNSLLKSESWCSTTCKHFTDTKSLSNFAQNKKEFTASQELIIGFGPDTAESNPILRTLGLLISHEDVHGEVFKGTIENTEVVMRSINDGEMWKENALFTSD